MALFTRDKPASVDDIACCFCKKQRADVKKLVAGPDRVAICDECLERSSKVISDEHVAQLEAHTAPPARLTEIVAHLDARVIGQAAAKRAVGAALVAHTLRLADEDPTKLRVPRVLLVGPRGCGTQLAAALCTFQPKLPSYHADTSRLTETGYVGENVENFLACLLEGVPPSIAHGGLLFLDGLQHLAEAPAAKRTRDVSGAEAQRDIIRILDGLVAQVTLARPRHPQQGTESFPTRALLVAAAWTIAEVPSPSSEESLRAALVADGMVPDLLARFDRVVALHRLTQPELAQVLDRELESTRTLMTRMGTELRLFPEAVQLFSSMAARSPDGAFALRRPLALIAEEALTSDTALRVVDGEAAQRYLA